MTVFKKVSKMMFEEYNEIALEYEIEPFQNLEEVEETLEANLTKDDCLRLEDDEMARMALSGFVAGIMMAANISIIDMDNIEGGTDGNKTSH
jgi:hypothetical protein